MHRSKAGNGFAASFISMQDVFWRYSWYQSLRSAARAARALHQVRHWEHLGRCGPPPHTIKQQVLKRYASQYGLRILVESGTYHGDMIDALKGSFESVYSIELNTTLFDKACWRFRREPHIKLINGDSGNELQTVLQKLEGPALFWLDGHYSAGVTGHGALSTPILDEVRHVLTASERRHIMVIDDARCFGSEPDYPTISELSEFIRGLRPDVQVEVEYDSIRVLVRE